jgi:predicted lipid-binding transport protein (Tim44 family)
MNFNFGSMPGQNQGNNQSNNQGGNQQPNQAQSAAQMSQVANAQSMANQGGGGLLGGLATGGLSNLWAWN